MLKTGIQSTTSIASQASSSCISSGGDWGAVRDSFNSLDDWSGIAASTAGSLVTNSLGEINLNDGNRIALNGKRFNTGSIGTFNSFAGGAVSTAVTYGMTGSATLNVASIAGQGVLEMHFGKDGFHTNLGTGGTDVSAGTLSKAVAGAGNLCKNIQINSAAKANNMSGAATALRTQWGFGDSAQKAQLESILDGSTKLAAGGTDGRAQTVLENGQRTVYLSGYKEDMTRGEQLSMCITLGHEAYRDGVTGTAREQFMETANAVSGHTALALRMTKDSSYSGAMGRIINSSQILKDDIQMFMTGSSSAYRKQKRMR